jgi:4-amino-4-deoxy-L-arabinose transferase-like glycosyltransferase
VERLESGTRTSRLAELAILTVLVLASVALFSDRAIFADEHIYLKLAESALKNPLFPADTPLLFFGLQRPNYIGHTHPPVGEYYIAAIYAVLGHFSEIPFRLLFAVFPVMAVLAFYFLARRFTAEPFFVAALFAVSPAFFVLAPTLMMDVPVIALLLAGLAMYFRGWLAGAAVCFILAVGAGYAALVPLGCLGLILLLTRRPVK